MALVFASQWMQPKAGLIHVARLSGGAQHVQDATYPRDVCRVQVARVTIQPLDARSCTGTGAFARIQSHMTEWGFCKITRPVLLVDSS